MEEQNKILSRESFDSLLAEANFVRGDNLHEPPYEPESDDLYFLYAFVRETACLAVLEFGSGWSTFALAQGLLENFETLADSYAVRHPNPFRLMTVDASSEWLQISLQRLTPAQRKLVEPVHSVPRLVEYRGAYATLFDHIPTFVPDLIYLDGPDPDQVEGSIAGFHLAETHGLPMAADLLRIEPHLWPGTVIVTDGRTANARFLRDRFVRPWDFYHDPFGDRCLFRLSEPGFGTISETHTVFRLTATQDLRRKEKPMN